MKISELAIVLGAAIVLLVVARKVVQANAASTATQTASTDAWTPVYDSSGQFKVLL